MAALNRLIPSDLPAKPSLTTPSSTRCARALASSSSVIRKDIEQQFREIVGTRFEKRIAVDYVYQELDIFPPLTRCPPDAPKPWGTTHAILMAADTSSRKPFAAINADDFYGQRLTKFSRNI